MGYGATMSASGAAAVDAARKAASMEAWSKRWVGPRGRTPSKATKLAMDWDATVVRNTSGETAVTWISSERDPSQKPSEESVSAVI